MKSKLLRIFFDKFSGSKYLSVWMVVCIDVLLSTLMTFLTVLSLHSFEGQDYSSDQTLSICIISFFSSIFSFYLFKTYRNVIRFSRLKDSLFLFLASLCKVVIMLIAVRVLMDGVTMTYVIPYCVADAMATVSSLIIVRITMIVFYESMMEKNPTSAYISQRLLIYGVSEVAVSLVTRLASDSRYTVCGFCSDDEKNRDFRLTGKNVYSFDNESHFLHTIHRESIQSILFPNVAMVRRESERLIPFCQKHHIKVLIAPPVGEFSENNGSASKIRLREIEVEDLLNRPEITIDMTAIKGILSNSVVLVTGAAGSIGSEICRQLAITGVVRHIVMFDIAETPLHNLRLEFQDKYSYQSITPVIGDVRSLNRLNMVFMQYHPIIVFHAAAYKHVPLMEENPCEAVLVNVMGTKNVADMCMKYKVQRMVMISTDKAVNPTSFMGASKRMAEIYVQSLGMAESKGEVNGKTLYITTRFGNVLGSNGSVVPRFREQISKGGPVTVTHPDIIRFFMTIPEACRLVLDAAALGKDNEIFVFDMGDPVKIVDLARRMISLSGLCEGEDIKIEYTGLRPGEKLYEEVLSDNENTLPTTQNKIRIAQARLYDYSQVEEQLKPIIFAAEKVKIPDMLLRVRELVPEYISQNSWLEKL